MRPSSARRMREPDLTAPLALVTETRGLWAMAKLLIRWRAAAPALAVLVLAVGPSSGASALAQRAPGDCTIDVSELELSPVEQDMLALINAYRTEKTLPTLAVSPLLTKAAARSGGGA